MESDSMTVEPASRLRRWRLEHGVKVKDVADLTGLSEAHISRIERGENRAAPLTKIRMARQLGVRVADIFDPEDVVGPDWASEDSSSSTGADQEVCVDAT
jgi:transcriptional regulator with XRE-family HTH domain